MKFDEKSLLLYAVTDRAWLGARTLRQAVEEAIRGGVTMVQLREKTLDDAAFLREAQEIQAVCRQYHVPFLINDNVELAAMIDADGVHIGQHDAALPAARSRLGADKIIGVSVQSVEQALAAAQGGADYLGVGAVFPTSTKSDADSVSLHTLRQICDAVSIPVCAIGGIDKDNLAQLRGTGIAGVAVVSAVFAQADITTETRKLLSRARALQ